MPAEDKSKKKIKKLKGKGEEEGRVMSKLNGHGSIDAHDEKGRKEGKGRRQPNGEKGERRKKKKSACEFVHVNLYKICAEDHKVGKLPKKKRKGKGGVLHHYHLIDQSKKKKRRENAWPDRAGNKRLPEGKEEGGREPLPLMRQAKTNEGGKRGTQANSAPNICCSTSSALRGGALSSNKKEGKGMEGNGFTPHFILHSAHPARCPTKGKEEKASSSGAREKWHSPAERRNSARKKYMKTFGRGKEKKKGEVKRTGNYSRIAKFK